MTSAANAPVQEAPCGCKRYADGTRYVCLSHRYRIVPTEAEIVSLREEVERMRSLLTEARAVLVYFDEDSSEKYATEEGARWLMRYDAIVAALDNEVSYARDGFPL